jgi:anaerobic magnesium-protoporphyrin IX monomethyl ester cyclase
MLMFRNTYPPEFYKKLHRYVHKSYREYVALENIKNIMTHPAAINWKSIKKALGLAYYVPAAFMAKQKLYAFEKTL